MNSLSLSQKDCHETLIQTYLLNLLKRLLLSSTKSRAYNDLSAHAVHTLTRDHKAINTESQHDVRRPTKRHQFSLSTV
jgi:hypothetical protein